MLSAVSLWALLFVPMFFFPGCPCCGTEGITCGTCDASFSVPLLPKTWRFTVSGITNGTQTDCSVFNATFDVVIGTTPEYSPAGCSINENCEGGLTDIDSSGNGVALAFEAFDVITPSQSVKIVALAFGDAAVGGAFATYCNSGINGACDVTSYVLTRTTTTGDCGGWPASITITAV